MKDRQRIQDILDAIEAIQKYTVPDYETFASDSKTQDAIFYNLIIIGEAANQLSDDFQEQNRNIPWSAMIGTRNIIVHGYDQVKLPIVWQIIANDLPDLKTAIVRLLSSENS